MNTAWRGCGRPQIQLSQPYMIFNLARERAHCVILHGSCFTSMELSTFLRCDSFERNSSAGISLQQQTNYQIASIELIYPSDFGQFNRVPRSSHVIERSSAGICSHMSLYVPFISFESNYIFIRNINGN